MALAFLQSFQLTDVGYDWLRKPTAAKSSGPMQRVADYPDLLPDVVHLWREQFGHEALAVPHGAEFWAIAVQLRGK